MFKREYDLEIKKILSARILETEILNVEGNEEFVQTEEGKQRVKVLNHVPTDMTVPEIPIVHNPVKSKDGDER